MYMHMYTYRFCMKEKLEKLAHMVIEMRSPSAGHLQAGRSRIAIAHIRTLQDPLSPNYAPYLLPFFLPSLIPSFLFPPSFFFLSWV
jgi:hypothetical protein